MLVPIVSCVEHCNLIDLMRRPSFFSIQKKKAFPFALQKAGHDFRGDCFHNEASSTSESVVCIEFTKRSNRADTHWHVGSPYLYSIAGSGPEP
jgi:hypothetical protein